MARVVAEVRYEIDVDDGELKLYKEEGLSSLMNCKGMFASEFEEITYEEVVEE